MLDFIIRWRTALLGFVLAALSAAPALLNAPEILAIVPPEWRPYVIAAGFLAMYLTRPRPATRASDPEVQVANAVSKGDSVLVVSPDKGTKAVIDA